MISFETGFEQPKFVHYKLEGQFARVFAFEDKLSEPKTFKIDAMSLLNCKGEKCLNRLIRNTVQSEGWESFVDLLKSVAVH